MRLVIVESPYAGDVDRNVRYGRAALADCLARGESPIASHLLLTQPGVLDDGDPAQRAIGVAAGHAWYAGADACVVYDDLGISIGMAAGIAAAQKANVPIEWRSLESWSRLDKAAASTLRVQAKDLLHRLVNAEGFYAENLSEIEDWLKERSVSQPRPQTDVPQPRLIDEGVICDRCGRKWDPAKGEGSGCETCLTAIQAARGGR